MIEDRPLTQAETEEVRRRQQARARVMGIGLALLCALFFAITIAKIGILAP
jgi:predicted tellurium resistance membrane protein TerC